MSTDRNPESPEEKEATKQRMRAALDVLQQYTTAEGKIDATKLTQRIAALERDLAQARKERDECGERLEFAVGQVREFHEQVIAAHACMREVRGIARYQCPERIYRKIEAAIDQVIGETK